MFCICLFVCVFFVCLCLVPGPTRCFALKSFPGRSHFECFGNFWICCRFKFEATNAISCLTSTPPEVKTFAQTFYINTRGRNICANIWYQYQRWKYLRKYLISTTEMKTFVHTFDINTRGRKYLCKHLIYQYHRCKYVRKHLISTPLVKTFAQTFDINARGTIAKISIWKYDLPFVCQK